MTLRVTASSFTTVPPGCSKNYDSTSNAIRMAASVADRDDGSREQHAEGRVAQTHENEAGEHDRGDHGLGKIHGGAWIDRGGGAAKFERLGS
jgi:hypothetical protein